MSNLTRTFDFLNGKTFYIATTEGDQPRVRPFAFVAVIEDKLYFANNTSKPSYQQLLANPKIEISATSDDGSEWIRLSGTIVYDIRQEIIDAALDARPSLKALYDSPDAPQFAPFYIKDAVAVFSSLSAAPETVEF